MKLSLMILPELLGVGEKLWGWFAHVFLMSLNKVIKWKLLEVELRRPDRRFYFAASPADDFIHMVLLGSVGQCFTCSAV